MRFAPAILAAAILLTGCAGTRVAVFDGEVGEDGAKKPTGAVAPLDMMTGEDLGILDKANSLARIGKKRVSSKLTSADKLNKRYGALLATLPPPPRKFILLFETGGTNLIEGSDALIDQMFAEIAARPGADVEITGHTDSVGEGGINDRLSLERAEAIQQLLVARGLKAEISRPIGRGEREPIDKIGENDAPSEQNRRVEIFVK